MRRFLLALVALVVVGCDPVVDKHTPDGHVADASPDAQTHGMVSLKVYDPNNTGGVAVGVPVVFIEADGTLVGHPATGSDGIAMADVHRGASATVVITTQGSTQLQTVFALVPGDTIVLGPNTPQQTTDGTFVVSFPAYGGGAANYRVYGPCGSGFSTAPPQTLTMYSDCKLATMDLQVIAYDQNGNALAYIDKPAVAYTAGGNTTISGSYLPMSTFTASYTNIDASITSISMNRSVPDGYGTGGGATGAPSNGTYTATATGPQGTDATITTRATNGRLENIVIQKIPGNSLTYGQDVGATLLPWIDQPTFDIPSRRISVPITTTGTTMDQPDVFYADVGYARTVGQTTTYFAWLIVGPAPGDVTLPEMPAEIGEVMPQAGDQIENIYAAALEADTLNGWDAVRPDIYTAINGIIDAPHPAAMRIRESTFSGAD